MKIFDDKFFNIFYTKRFQLKTRTHETDLNIFWILFPRPWMNKSHSLEKWLYWSYYIFRVSNYPDKVFICFILREAFNYCCQYWIHSDFPVVRLDWYYQTSLILSETLLVHTIRLFETYSMQAWSDPQSLKISPWAKTGCARQISKKT